jgi:DNA repair exonuclease SbcCD ATPase subunit
MIKKITIENFRSHKKTELILSEGVNCIVGLPDSGKTNIIRAINWVLTNRPLGFRFHSNFTKDPTSVEIEFDDKQIIGLVKSKTKSAYFYNDVPLEAVGSDVPDTVANIANIAEHNLQTQMDKPFLICETGGEVAKIFNRISNMEKPDKVIAALTTEINSLNKQSRMLLLEQTELQDQLDALVNIPKMKNDIKKIEAVNKTLEKSIEDVRYLQNQINEIQAVQRTIEEMVDTAKAKQELQKIETKNNEIKSIDNTELSTLIKNIEESEDVMNRQYNNHNEARKEYQEFLKTIKICPYCNKCKTPIDNHDLNVKELEI